MDSSEDQTLDHREKAHSLAFLLFFAKEKENANVTILDKTNSQVLTHRIKWILLFYESFFLIFSKNFILFTFYTAGSY